jgi:acetyltransferase-like isoleucine patch superfamily enzyme
LSRFSGLQGADARAAEVGAVLRGGRMFARGLAHKPRFGQSDGPLFIGRGVRLSGLRHVRHVGRLVVEDDAELQGLSSEGVVFGADVSIGARTAIRPSSYYGGEVGVGLTVGDRSSFNTGCFIGCSGRITIGSDVMFGPGVQIYSENHVYADAALPIKDQGVERSFVTIEDDCWIGAGTIVTAGVTIGRGSVIGSGSVVTRDIPPGSIAVGSPARVIRQR